MTCWRWDPDSYLESMLDEIPSYFELQDRTVAATDGLEPRAALELGIGTAETAKRMLAQHAALRLTAVDSSPDAGILREGGVFVLADVVVPEDPADQQIPIDWEMDLPDRLDDQLGWLRAAGLHPEPLWTYKDLAVARASRGPLR